MTAADTTGGNGAARVGDRLRLSRCAARLTIRQMGERLGVSNDVVNGYEREATPIPERIISTYAELTGISEDWIRTGAGEPPPLHGEPT